jgi:type II secretory pathway component GspD/PulD (secretin)
VTLDNQTANIVVGQKYPQPEYTYNTEQAQMQVSGWSYLDIGVILEVTPHVNKAGFVTLDINPQVSAIDSYATVEGTSMPILATEETKTQVMIKDGETLVIAGLVKDQLTDTKKKIPLLGDIPLLGLIFQKKETTKTKTDLLIFITPHIITPSIAPEEPEV